jgi:SAM-dependent methyltransferase
MAKTSDPGLPIHPVDDGEPITPGPEIEVEPLTPPPEPSKDRDVRNGGVTGEMSRPLTPTPVPSSWAAQPLQPMAEEATVPLPVEEVEFADTEDELLVDRGAPTVLTGPVRPDPSRVAASLPSRLTPPPTPALESAARSAGGAANPADGAMPVATSGSDSRPARTSPPPAPGSDGARARPAGPPPTIPGPPLATPPTGAVLPLLPPGASWSEALSQRPRKKRLKPWFEEVFDEDYLRTLPFMTAEQTLREVAFIKESLRPPADAEILDVGCGYGRHAIELGQGGYRVTGIDLSLPLLIRAADESQRRALSVNFVHADMREMAFDGQFDGAYSFLTSFGYFDEETNLKVAASVYRSLKPGGRFLLDTINRDYIVSDLPTRVWWEGDGCVVLEEVDFNFQTNRLTVRRSIVFQDGRQVEHDISIRAYSLHELAKLLRQAGFRVLEVSGSVATRGHFFGATSRSVIILCERPAE